MARKRRGRNEGAIFRRGDGLWVSSISLGYHGDGKRKRKTVYGATKQEVQEKLRQLQTDNALGRLSDGDKFSLEDYLTLWLEDTVRTKTGPTTYDRYTMIVKKQIIPHIGGVRLNKLTAMHIVQLYATLEKKGESARTRQMTGTILYGALKRAVQLNLLVHNYCQDVARPRVEKKEMKAYDQAQLQRFLEAAAADRLYALYVLAVETGMRQGELFGLQWPDIDFPGGTIQVQRSLEELRGEFRLKPPKTQAGRRRIELSPFAVDVLNEHRKRMLAEGRDARGGQVFCDEKGGFLRKSNVSRRSFRGIINRVNGTATKEAEKTNTVPDMLPRIRFHDLRHTSATLLLMAGENPKVVSERLGHEDIQITLTTYSHVLPTMQKGAAEKMNRIFTGRQEKKDAESRKAAEGGN